MLPMDCDLALAHPLMQRIVQVESAGNPHAIGVVGASLERQPREAEEAVATALSLRSAGMNFSIGLAQVNQVHFKRLGWTADLRKGFDRCANVSAGVEIFNACYARAIAHGYPTSAADGAYSATHAALSCYYSGDLVAGARLGYVEKVLGATASAPTKVAARRLPQMMLSMSE